MCLSLVKISFWYFFMLEWSCCVLMWLGFRCWEMFDLSFDVLINLLCNELIIWFLSDFVMVELILLELMIVLMFEYFVLVVVKLDCVIMSWVFVWVSCWLLRSVLLVDISWFFCLNFCIVRLVLSDFCFSLVICCCS